jgi:purine-binding chemotaxis protein CheW
MSDMIDEVFDEEEDSQRDRYLTFTLDGNTYGVSIRFVTEIIGVQPITKVPETPDYIKGIINLRGKVIPLIDVRLKFGKKEIPYTERTCVIVVDTGELLVGLIVDTVDDVQAIPAGSVASAPDGSLGFEDRYIEGVGDVDGKVTLLLNMDRFLRAEEADAAERAAGAESGAEAETPS